MKTSRAGLDILKKWEGCRLKAYPDPGTGGDPWTIGYGHTSAAGAPAVSKGLTITQQEAEDILARDLVKYETAVKKALTRTPTQSQFDAMVSLCYNIGPGAFAGSSVVRRFNQNDVSGSADAFLMWTKAGGREMKGLVNRRKDERALFLTKTADAPTAPVPPPVAPIPAPPPEYVPPSTTPAQSLAAMLLGAIAAAFAAFAYWMTKG